MRHGADEIAYGLLRRSVDICEIQGNKNHSCRTYLPYSVGNKVGYQTKRFWTFY
jgi:hypothetical protein